MLVLTLSYQNGRVVHCMQLRAKPSFQSVFRHVDACLALATWYQSVALCHLTNAEK